MAPASAWQKLQKSVVAQNLEGWGGGGRASLAHPPPPPKSVAVNMSRRNLAFVLSRKV